MLKKIDNKKFILSLTGLVDIYSHFSAIVSDLQQVNKLPFERLDNFNNLCSELRKKVITIDDHSKCESESCSWPRLHSDKSHILKGKFPNHDQHSISSDEGESIYFTRSVRRMLDLNSTSSFESQVYDHLKKFVTNLYKNLSEVFTIEDKAIIETSRTVTDWISFATQLKSRSLSVIYLLEKFKFVEACLKIDRNLGQFTDLEISNQFRLFLSRLQEVTKDDSVEKLEKTDPKDLIKRFLVNEDLYSGIEAVTQACVVGSIKISVESVAESMISKYNIHSSNIRGISDDVADDEMMVDYNGPDIGEADKLLMESLYLHFKNNRNGIHFHTGNILRSYGKTVESILSTKSRIPLYK